MRGSSPIGEPARRRMRQGQGIVVALVIWTVTLAFLYALIQSQAQGGALGGVIRATSLKTVVFAGQSALAEAIHVVRHPKGGLSPVMTGILAGQDDGDVHPPEATRDIYSKIDTGGNLTIGDITYAVVSRPAGSTSSDPFLIDILVRVSLAPRLAGAPTLTRQIRRRHVAKNHPFLVTPGGVFRNTSGGFFKPDERVHSILQVDQEPLIEVIDP